MPDLPAIAILDDYQRVSGQFADWSRLDGRASRTVFDQPLADADAVVAALADFEIVVAMRERTAFPAEVLSRLPKLRLLVTTGLRNASIDVAAAAERGVVVCATRAGTVDTAALAWGLILTAARRLDVEVRNVRDGGWMTTVGQSLTGATLGVVGLGRLGSQVATIGQAFGMRVVAWSANLTDERCAEVGATRMPTLADLLAVADFASVHLVLSDRTRGLIGAEQLAAMKPTAWLVNTGRGPICDEAALADACRDGTIAGAAVDVYDTEPLPADHPFRTLPNVIATPHIGYVTDASYAQWFPDAVEAVEAFLDGTPVRRLEPS